MNAAAKALEQAYLSNDNFWILLFGRRNLSLIALLGLVILSAFCVIYVKDLNRRLTSEVQNQELTRNEIIIDRSKLLLEKSTWAAPVRVQNIASKKWDMRAPDAKQVVIIHLGVS
jgi:cell division protein FtsL